MVILTAIIGGFLIKREGIKTLNYLKLSRITEPQNLIKALRDGLFIVLSGIFLLTPGFATDLFGFILFFKPIQRIKVKSHALVIGVILITSRWNSFAIQR